MPAVAPLVLYPHFVFPTRGVVSFLLAQWLASEPLSAPLCSMLGTTSRARSNLLSSLDGERLPAVAFNHDALGAPPVERAHLHFLNLVARFDILDYLCQCTPFLLGCLLNSTYIL